MAREYSLDKLNGEMIFKSEYDNDGVVRLDTAACRGNYGYTRHTSAKNVTFNDGAQNVHIHETGKTSIHDVRITFYGMVTYDNLCNIVAHAKYHDYYVTTSNNRFKVVSGIANKFHGLGTWQKFMLAHCNGLHCNVEEFDHETNDFICKYNLDGVDVVKWLQEFMERGFPTHMITNREDYI